MSQDPKTQLEDLIALVDHADSQIQQGIIIDITDLENQVVEICNNITNGNPAIARELQPFIADLIARLDNLAGNLENFKNTYKER